MLAALFEWMLWLGAFIYCLVKVYIKADHWSIRVLAVLMAFLFTAMRYDSKGLAVFSRKIDQQTHPVDWPSFQSWS